MKHNHNSSTQLKEELYKLINDDDNFNTKLISDNMDYLIDITPTIEELRANNIMIIPFNPILIYWLL